MLDRIFLELLNLTLSASFVIFFVMLARLFLRGAPRRFSWMLWAVVLVRLLVPFSIESEVSLVPIRREVFTRELIYEVIPTVDSGSAVVDALINPMLPPVENEAASVNPIQISLFLAELVWIAGMVVLVGVSIVKLVLLLRKLRGAALLEGESGVYVTDRVETPFVIGLVKPRIYLPESLGEGELRYILEHERIHIRRGDHIIRILAFVALTMHWFNPLVWAAFALAMRDMEMSCDEAVLERLGDIRAEYSESLLSLTVGRTPYSPTPLAFGEGDTKGRIVNIVRYKKPKPSVCIIAAVAVIALGLALMLGLARNVSRVELGFGRYYGEPYKLSLELPDGWSYSESTDNFYLTDENGSVIATATQYHTHPEMLTELHLTDAGLELSLYRTLSFDGTSVLYGEYRNGDELDSYAIIVRDDDRGVMVHIGLTKEYGDHLDELARSIRVVEHPEYAPSEGGGVDHVELGFGFGETDKVALVMPSGWSYATDLEPKTLMPLFENSVALTKNGEYAGYLGFSHYTEYEGFEDTDFSDQTSEDVIKYVEMACNMLYMPPHYRWFAGGDYIDGRDDFVAAYSLGDKLVYFPTIYRQTDNGDSAAAWPSELLDGILILDYKNKCYVGIEFEPGTVTRDELESIAKSILIGEEAP